MARDKWGLALCLKYQPDNDGDGKVPVPICLPICRTNTERAGNGDRHRAAMFSRKLPLQRMARSQSPFPPSLVNNPG